MRIRHRTFPGASWLACNCVLTLISATKEPRPFPPDYLPILLPTCMNYLYRLHRPTIPPPAQGQASHHITSLVGSHS